MVESSWRIVQSVTENVCSKKVCWEALLTCTLYAEPDGMVKVASIAGAGRVNHGMLGGFAFGENCTFRAYMFLAVSERRFCCERLEGNDIGRRKINFWRDHGLPASLAAPASFSCS
jgi:hypothetical protein